MPVDLLVLEVDYLTIVCKKLSSTTMIIYPSKYSSSISRPETISAVALCDPCQVQIEVTISANILSTIGSDRKEIRWRPT